MHAIFEALGAHIRSEAFAEQARLQPSVFTRKRRLPLATLVNFLFNAPRAGLQSELDGFFDHALHDDAVRSPGKSALCQARRQLRPQALRELIPYSARLCTQHAEAPLWHGYRVLALDSTVLKVPKVPECAAHFGGMQPSNAAFRPLARASALLDVARGTFVDAVLGGYAEDDRSLAARHLQHLGSGDLLVMDRGYPARGWLGQLVERQVRFCARMPEHWRQVKTFLRGAADDAQVSLGTAKAPLTLRLLRFVLPRGTCLVLVTNVLDETLSPEDFAALYRERWRIEEAFKLIKARLQVENFSGVLPHTVEQDFYATLVRSNCAAALALAARPEEASLGTPPVNARGWRVKLNRTLALKSLRHYLPQLLLALHPAATLARLIQRLRASHALERTRPGRSSPRRERVRLAEFHPAYKAA